MKHKHLLLCLLAAPLCAQSNTAAQSNNAAQSTAPAQREATPKSPPTPAPPPASRAAQLDQVAHTAEIMLDGDTITRIETPRSARMILDKDPRDPWKASDNFDVNDAAFIQTKKTLIRLAQLCPDTCDVNLWVPVKADPTRIQILIRNVNELSQFWKWGDLHQPTPPEMQQVLKTGRRLAVSKRPGITSVLAPVRNSLGDIVALAEVASTTNRDPRENVK